MAPDNDRTWLSAPELARQADVSQRTARRWILQHGLGRRVGGRLRADRERASKFVALMTTGATDDHRRL